MSTPPQPQQEKLTTTRITKFERAQLVGMRMEQIARGAEPTVEVDDSMTVRDVVLEEIRRETIPLMVSRALPNGKTEMLRIGDLQGASPL